MGCWQDTPMAAKVGAGALSGVIVGLLFAQQYECPPPEEGKCNPKILLGLPGDLWLRSLSCVVLPLLFSNMVVVANSMAAITNSGRMGSAAICYYMTTTVIAVITGISTGLLLVVPWTEPPTNATEPVPVPTTPPNGTNVTMEALAMGVQMLSSTINNLDYGDEFSGRRLQIRDIDTVEQVTSILHSVVPSNIFDALANFNLLGCIVFAFVLGVVVHKDSLIVSLASEVNDAAFTVIKVIIEFTPIGVCFLIAPNVMVIDIDDIKNCIPLVVAIPAGLLLHVMVVYPTIYALMTGKNPFTYMKGLLPAVFTALGTSSSAATLPMTLKCVVEDLGIDEVVAKFVLTIGATANMDGSAIYFPIAVMWLARTVGWTITFGDIVTLIFMCTLAAIGASPIPSSGLVLVKLISESVGFASDGNMPPLFGVVVALDPFFDRGCTMVNICGDGMGAGIIAAVAPPGENEVLEIPMSVEASVMADARLKAGEKSVDKVEAVFEGMTITASGRQMGITASGKPRQLELPAVY